MKKHIVISLMLSLHTVLFAQQDPLYPPVYNTPDINYVEYFFDTDPGLGNGTEISVIPDIDISNILTNINLNGLSNGSHTLYLRSRDENNKWSMTTGKVFVIDHDPVYPTAQTQPNIAYAEYFFNSDPGFGNGTSISINTGTELSAIVFDADISGLPIGAHSIFLRTQDSNGKWSITAINNFILDSDPEYPAAPLPIGNIIAAEYFIDTDPGFGQAIPITITPGTEIADIEINADTNGLSDGLHSIYVRTQNENGSWSQTARKTFVVGDDAIWLASNEWRNGIEPNAERNVVIEGNLTVGTDYPEFEAMNIIVSETGSIIIPDDQYISVYGMIINNASAESFSVAGSGNLIQTDISAQNIGNITVLQECQPMVRLDYTMWSSPVSDQNLFGFSPDTVNGVTNHPGSAGRIYIYDGTSGYINPQPFTEDAVMNKGIGYLFRSPNNWSPDIPASYQGIFTGVPNNGNITVPTHPGSYTSVGNPYPSAIAADHFISENPGISILYFWNNNHNAGNNYAACTLGNCVAAVGGGNTPNGTIPHGQGFIVETDDSSVSFTNEMRSAGTGIFFKADEMEKHRFWLDLGNGEGLNYNQMLAGYISGATNEADHQIDGKFFEYEGSALYSIIGENKFAIQGRALPFKVSDIIKLGLKAAEKGKFSISLSNFDGLFAEDEIIIYLKDNYLNIIHNLMKSNYKFESDAGEFNDRFEIIYESGGMGTEDLNLGSVQIYTHNEDIKIESKNEKILSIELFDMSGRSTYKNEKVNSSHYEIKSSSKGIIIVKVQTQNGEIVTKKLINK